MTTETFIRCFAVVIGTEGGYVNDPLDPGGETKFGVSKRAYPDVDIAALTMADAQAIYFRDYWLKIAGDSLPVELAFLVFDAAVNSGVSRAVKWLQATAHVIEDGVIGPKTLAAVNAAQPGWAMAAEYNHVRLLFMIGLPTWKRYGNGWARRLCRAPYQARGVAA